MKNKVKLFIWLYSIKELIKQNISIIVKQFSKRKLQ